jgi:hypothetical protein
MPRNKDLKRLVRARMAETGENYTSALARILGETDLELLPEPWHLTGSRRADYQVGLLPRTETYEGNRIVLLHSRPEVSAPEDAVSLHFGALLSGAGGLELTGTRFGEVDETVPVTTRPYTETLPEEPQALDFGALASLRR